MAPDDLTDGLQHAARSIILLARAGNEMTDLIRESTPSEAMVANTAMMAAAFLRLEGPLRPSELAERLAITTGGATKLVARLERDGLVTKTPEVDDRRALLVELTPSGTRTVDAILTGLVDIIRSLEARFGVLHATA